MTPLGVAMFVENLDFGPIDFHSRDFGLVNFLDVEVLDFDGVVMIDLEMFDFLGFDLFILGD